MEDGSKNREFGYAHIRVRYTTREEAMAELAERIRHGEEKHGMSSAEMEKLFSTGDDQWDTVEILKWMSAYHAYQSLSGDKTRTGGKAGTTTGPSTKGD